MPIERQKHLGVGPYERSAARQGHGNGYNPKMMQTRVGKITFDVPQVREGGFYLKTLCFCRNFHSGQPGGPPCWMNNLLNGENGR